MSHKGLKTLLWCPRKESYDTLSGELPNVPRSPETLFFQLLLKQLPERLLVSCCVYLSKPDSFPQPIAKGINVWKARNKPRQLTFQNSTLLSIQALQTAWDGPSSELQSTLLLKL
jgi:hypothetical protein